MKWGRKHHHHQQQQKPTSYNQQQEGTATEPQIKKQSSPFSLSNLLPLSWLSKLKHHHSHPPPRNTPNIPHNPLPVPNLSPPPLPVAPVAPRRLSVGDDDTHLARTRARSRPARTRTHSLGSDPEFLPLRADSLLLDPVRTRTAQPQLRRRRCRCRRPAPEPASPRRSFSGRIRPRVRVRSPRLAHPNPITQSQRLESFAVVKRSIDPVRDFRESMVEMIWERGIGRPEELESLLACYLSLNSDEHHDVIVKVFRQVWFDLNRVAGRIRVSVET